MVKLDTPIGLQIFSIVFSDKKFAIPFLLSRQSDQFKESVLMFTAVIKEVPLPQSYIIREGASWNINHLSTVKRSDFIATTIFLCQPPILIRCIWKYNLHCSPHPYRLQKQPKVDCRLVKQQGRAQQAFSYHICPFLTSITKNGGHIPSIVQKSALPFRALFLRCYLRW